MAVGALEAMITAIEALVRDLEPATLSGAAAARVAELAARGERLCGALKALAARRVAASGEWRSSGERSAAHWLAGRSGTSITSAMQTLEMAERLCDLPRVDAAVRAGELSSAQAKEIASAAAADPSAERELLDAARTDGLPGLRERCRRVRAAACPDERARHGAIHSSRYLRHFTDADGAGRIDARCTPEVLAEVRAALEPFEAEVFKAARAEGRREGFDAYRLDALVAMARAAGDGDGCGRSGPRHTVNVVIDHQALVNGTAGPGERSEIDGVGPVPVGVVRSLMDDAFVNALLTDGVDVLKVAHLGRRPTAHQRSALLVRDPECVVAGCHVRVGLEIDHVDPWCATRVTRLDRLARLCRFHHAQKTHEGYRLEGGPGHWRWLAPEGTEVAARPPPTNLDDDTGTIKERRARIYDAALANVQAVFGV